MDVYNAGGKRAIDLDAVLFVGCGGRNQSDPWRRLAERKADGCNRFPTRSMTAIVPAAKSAESRAMASI